MSAPPVVRPVRPASRVRCRTLGNTTPVPSGRRRRRRRWLALPVVVALAIVSLVALAPAAPDEPLWDQFPPPQPGFADAMGYRPVMVMLAGGVPRPAKPSGDCSGLWDGEPFGFAPVCQVHDHGYDLIRASVIDGEPVDTQVRKQVDAMFAGDLRAHCAATQRGLAEVACHGVRQVMTGAVALNSWRQGYGVPREEPVVVWLLGATLFAAAVGGLVLAGRRLRAPMIALAERTPDDRDRYADLLRTASLLAVVVGHWLMMVVTRTPDGPAVGNLLGAVPALQPATWLLQVMPVFFFVGGFANQVTWRHIRARGGGLADYLAGRGRRLVTPAVVLAVTWSLAGPLLTAAGVRADHVGTAVRLVAQPLWFLAVFLAASAMVPVMTWLHDRHGALVAAGLGAGVVLVDVLRFGFGLTAVGWLNIGLVWLCVQQVGFFYADGRLQAVPRRRLVLLVLSGLLTLVALTSIGSYPISMVGIPGASVSNMTPPTVAILALGLVQLGLVLLLRPRGTAWLARPRVWAAVVATGSMAMTLFLWHLTAAVAVVGFALAAEVPLAAGGTLRWWLERPFWLFALTVVLLCIALVAGKLERPRSRAPVGAATSRGSALAVSAVVAAVAGFGWLATSGFGGAGAAGIGLLVAALVGLGGAAPGGLGARLRHRSRRLPLPGPYELPGERGRRCLERAVAPFPPRGGPPGCALDDAEFRVVRPR